VVVQGFGKVGGAFAELIEELGAKVDRHHRTSAVAYSTPTASTLAPSASYVKTEPVVIEGFDGGDADQQRRVAGT
jgi:glutamate dehydrogenase/leucine dehydrogenase